MTEFGVELFHYHKRVLTILCSWISLSKTCCVYKDRFYFMREKDWYIDSKIENKDSVLLFLHENSVLFYTWGHSLIMIQSDWGDFFPKIGKWHSAKQLRTKKWLILIHQVSHVYRENVSLS